MAHFFKKLLVLHFNCSFMVQVRILRLFGHFSFFPLFCIVKEHKCSLLNLPMAGFEPGVSGVGNDRTDD